ncbi:MAG: nitrate/nitrite transporter NrtS [Chloroflexi bacterium]|nr:nitrate/nitrite transporter NrtS [Chloroflexota bacterium]
MAEAIETHLTEAAPSATCEQCGRHAGKGWAFAFKKPVPAGAPDGDAADKGAVTKCSRCAFRHRPMLRRSLIVAVVVGTILTALNQGDIIFAGSWESPLYWKVPLTFCVPFCVATYGALSNVRR